MLDGFVCEVRFPEYQDVLGHVMGVAFDFRPFQTFLWQAPFPFMEEKEHHPLVGRRHKEGQQITGRWPPQADQIRRLPRTSLSCV